jgi:hypothetical protein
MSWLIFCKYASNQMQNLNRTPIGFENLWLFALGQTRSDSCSPSEIFFANFAATTNFRWSMSGFACPAFFLEKLATNS